MLKTKIRSTLTMQRILAVLTLIVLVALSLNGPLQAQDAGIIQGYGSDEQLQRGMIVQLKKSDTSKVEPNSLKSIDQMHGVVVDANDAPFTISNEGAKVFVAQSGRYDVLVTDQNGPISPGDYITISALNGIGMKAGTKEPVVIGRALDGFDGKQGVISTSEVRDTAGTTKTVNLGRVGTDITVNRNPNLKAEEPNVPEVLRKAAESIAGKQVNPARIYISVVIFLVSAVIAGSLLYSGVRNGIISLGRNPLSRKSVIRGMLQVVLVGLIIFFAGLFGVYLLLKL
jgi:hypothetical protein